MYIPLKTEIHKLRAFSTVGIRKMNKIVITQMISILQKKGGC